MTNEKIVENGYDKIAERYHAERSQFEHNKELAEFMELLPKKAKVLDIGCGAGVPVAKILDENGFAVTGIDLSENMLKLARKHVPNGTFIKKDMTILDFDDDSFDGSTAFYSIIHVPRERHPLIFQGLHNVLKAGGIIFVCMGPNEWEATAEYKGTQMYWSHYAPKQSLQIIKDAGFQILFDKIMTRGGETHYWVLAKNIK